MKTGSPVDMAKQLGADRVIAPAGALPQPAERLDASGPVRLYEFEVAVERLCLDSTSFRNIRERSDADPRRMADRRLDAVFAAAYEAAHESVYNCLVAARPARRLDGTMQEGFPVEALSAPRAPDPS
jgi:hypothetical protein